MQSKDWNAIRQTELNRSRKVAADFRRKNSSFVAKPMAEAAMREAVIVEQTKDLHALLAAGTWDGYDAKYLSGLSQQQIRDWHFDLRAQGYKVRTTEELLNAAAIAYEETFGQRLHRSGRPEDLAHRRVQDMKREAAKKRGLQSWEGMETDEDSEPSNLIRRDADGGVMTPASWTASWMGSDAPDVPADSAEDRHSRAFASVLANRKAASERK
jgi:hypothetical protein